MSILQTPRAYFLGNISWDPILTNNFPTLWDLQKSKPIFNAQNGTTVAEYRKTGADSVLTGNWNPDGTHRSIFFDTFVTGVDIGNGYTTDDGFVGVPVNLRAMLVDVDPYITNTSQLFYDQMSWGIDGGNRVLATREKRMTGSHINFARNTTYKVIAGLASVIWQASFEWSSLVLDDRSSPLIGSFISHQSDPDVLGLTMRMNTYRTVYYGNDDGSAPTDEQQRALHEAILAGGFHPNPAVSVLVGILGLWRVGEPSVVPGDRFLPPAAGATGVAAAYAKAQGDKLWIDLGNSIPETNFELHKKDYGTLSVSATDPQGQVTPIGTIDYADYDKGAYERTSGLVSVELDTTAKHKAVTDGMLSVSSADAGPMFSERRYHACPEVPSLYLTTGELKAVDVDVLDRGEPAAAGVKVTAAVLGTSTTEQLLTTDAKGQVNVNLRGGATGESPVYLGAWQDPATPPDVPNSPNQLNSDTDAYISLRVWPADAEVAAMDPTWANVHEQVLRDWEALAPCMDNWLLLGDEVQCKAYAPMILRLTSDDNFEGFLYMPVTRDMTQGQRTLLHNWCHAVIGSQPPAPVEFAPPPSSDTGIEVLEVGGLQNEDPSSPRGYQRHADRVDDD